MVTTMQDAFRALPGRDIGGQLRRLLSNGTDRREPVLLGRVAVPRRDHLPEFVPVFAYCRLGRRNLALVLGRVIDALHEGIPCVPFMVLPRRPWWLRRPAG